MLTINRRDNLLLILRKYLAVAIVAVGLLLMYYACWVVTEGVWPQWRKSGWSLSGNNMILNRQWRGNELYLVVLLYSVVGLSLAACGVFLWRRSRSIPSRIDCE